jgi:hypothetical protein
MKKSIYEKSLILCLFVLTYVAINVHVGPFLASQIPLSNRQNFSNALKEITASYVEVNSAYQQGENVTLLVNNLNNAIALYDKALGENSTDAAQAINDLQNATRIATQVLDNSTILTRIGTTQKERQVDIALVESVMIILVAIIAYFYIENIYEFIWFHQRKNSMVIPTDE